jgi:hypothetical protein
MKTKLVNRKYKKCIICEDYYYVADRGFSRLCCSQKCADKLQDIVTQHPEMVTVKKTYS